MICFKIENPDHLPELLEDGAEEIEVGEKDSDLEIKDRIRKRDGNKCRDCGKTSQEHIDEFERDLDVHRLIPGAAYDPVWCVTLCRKCHGAKPKKVLDSLWHESLRFVVFNLYSKEDQKFVVALERFANSRDLTLGAVLRAAALKVVEEVERSDFQDACLQADGLW